MRSCPNRLGHKRTKPKSPKNMSLKSTRRFSHLPRILIFMLPEIIYPAIFRLHSETKIIRFPPEVDDSAGLYITVVPEKREGPLIGPGASGQAPDCGGIREFWGKIRVEMKKGLVLLIAALFIVAFSAMRTSAVDARSRNHNSGLRLPNIISLIPEFQNLGLLPRAQGKRDTCSLFAITALAEFEYAKNNPAPPMPRHA